MRKTKKAPSTRKPAARKSPKETLNKEEIVQLDAVAENHRVSERAWQQLTAVPEGDDRWSAVEDNLLAKPDRGESERRWKYFSK